MTNLLVIGLAALCLYGLQPVQPFLNELNEAYLSVNQTKSLRGLLALIVLFCHLAQRVDGSPLFGVFSRMGYLAVAVFFFLSGYGLQKQHMTRENYSKGFLRKRLLSVGLPYLIATALYWALYACAGELIPVQTVILNIFQGQPIVSFSWYILVSLIFYVIFWLLMRVCKKKNGMMVAGTAVWFVLFTALIIWRGFASYWYISTHLLVVGMFWAVHEEKILNFIRKYQIAAIAVVVLVLAGLLLLPERFSDGACQMPKLAISLFFTLAVILLMLKFRFGNPVLKYLGKISLEIYLMQGFVILLLGKFANIRNAFVYCILTIAGTVSLAAGLHVLTGKLLHRK